MKRRLLFAGLFLVIALVGCGKKEASPPVGVESTSNNTVKPDNKFDKPVSEEVTVHTTNSGYILEDRERSNGAIFHDMGAIEEYRGDYTEVSDNSSVSGNLGLSENGSLSDNSIASEEFDDPENRTIFLDPGHGGDAAGETVFNGVTLIRNAAGAPTGQFPANSLGTTTGTSGGGYSECDVVYQMADKAKDLLIEHGYSVVMSRDDVHLGALGGGTAIGNWERGRRAADYDAWVVFHADGGGGSGFHCVVYNSDPSYSNKISDAFIKYMEDKGRPVYTAAGFKHGYSGNSSIILQAPSMYLNCGGLLERMLYIEAGFMDNKSDLDYMVSEDGQKEIAEGILYALNDFFSRGSNSDISDDSDH